jgi:hypothetical protein
MKLSDKLLADAQIDANRALFIRALAKKNALMFVVATEAIKVGALTSEGFCKKTWSKNQRTSIISRKYGVTNWCVIAAIRRVVRLVGKAEDV